MNTAAAVLAVDDNATIRKAISMRLGAKGFEVVTAQDGLEALKLIGQKRFDLVLLDLQMPEMRGDEVLRRVRQQYSATELPVIILAASSDKADINRSLELGANDYIIKPGDLPILVARIRTQLALKDTVAKLREHSALMRKVFSLEAAGVNGYADDTEILLDDIDGVQSIPFDLLHDNMPMTCFTLTSDGNIINTNRFGAQFLGYSADEIVKRPLLDLYVADDRGLAQENLASAVDMPGAVQRWDIRHIKKNGDVIWMRNTARAVRYGRSLIILVTCEDIDDAYKMSEILSLQSLHDELTGLANRKALEQRLNQVIESAQTEKTKHSLAVIDLDEFMLINDTCGREGGDELLRQIARLLKSLVRTRDTIARIGADEFGVLMEDCPTETARETAEDLRRAIESHAFVWEGRRFKVSASLGTVAIDESCDTTGSVLSMADTACYAAKDSGRNRVHTYQPDDAPIAARHGERRWAARISEALAEDRFELNLQPIRSLTADGEDHYELLLRMRDEMGEIVMPGEFLPAAERYNLADRLDCWVIARAFEWLRQRPANSTHLCCINLSGQSIGNDGVLEFIFDQFDSGAAAPHEVCFEITETAAVADLVGATRFMQQLKERGCRFSLDDFGSGFSSLAYLKQLPVDFLKIDGAFVRDMANDSIDCAMVRSINDIGHVMGKRTIAEFVEDNRTLDMLRAVGVDFVQGYEIGRPVPLDQFEVHF
ncbi:MAG: EAL domain-containing protein [Gammaproteobacteria bacterium]|nr:EAL domain-containing protein [Gammaproteobacteria bacterium]